MLNRRLWLALASGWPIALAAQPAAPPDPSSTRAEAQGTTSTTTPIAPSAPGPAPGLHAEVPPPVKSLGVVVVEGIRPSSLPVQIPTAFEGIDRERIERQLNATDSPDALRYFPSLLVRKRYIGDYNHAILSSRASGTGNSARSAVYADGILLSNYLGNGVGGLAFPPRWGLVTPEEIERVDVLYGPFSAAYPGNSVGAVVDYVTRMPTRFEAHAKVAFVQQPFELYGTKETFRAWQASASLGDRAGAFAWWLNLNRTDSSGQPLVFPTRLLSQGTAGGSAPVVTGGAPGLNNANQPWTVLGAGTQYRTVQDHLKLKASWDLTPDLRATALLGLWNNQSDGQSVSYLRDGAGQPVYSGPFTLDGRTYSGAQALSGADFPLTRESLRHTMQGLTVQSRTGGAWDWSLAASRYDYSQDDRRQNSAANVQPASQSGGPGTLASGEGSGWDTLAFKGIWRPGRNAGGEAGHVVEFGLQQERYRLRFRTALVAGNYLTDPAGALASAVSGDATMHSLWVQDTWRLAQDWKTVLGLRAEQWEAREGRTDFSASSSLSFPARRERALSPKAALAWQAGSDWALKASLGRAVRMPTLNELYGATTTVNSQFVNDPNLLPEKSWTGELTAELGDAAEPASGSLRVTLFAEDTRNALYSQTTFDATANRNISRVQNVGRIASTGLEIVAARPDAWIRGLDLSASLTYADSVIRENAGFVAVPGDTVGKWQPNIPRWRASALASWRIDDRWTTTLGLRHSGTQYRTLNNADVNGRTYMGVSPFTVVDLRLHHRFDRHWSAALGIENLGNDRYWNFHPYPQRSLMAELRYDL